MNYISGSLVPCRVVVLFSGVTKCTITSSTVSREEETPMRPLFRGKCLFRSEILIMVSTIRG